MASELTDTGELYSPLVGLVYIFNLIVGTGALALPKAFGEGGWVISTLVIVMLAFMSFLTVTFVVEVMAASNALIRYRRKEKKKELEDSTSNSSDDVEDLMRDSDNEAKQRLLKDQDTLVKYSNVNAGRICRSHTDFFEITERVEMGQMVSLFFNKVGKVVFYICLVVYLYGDLAIYAVAVPKSLMNVTCNINGDDDKAECWKGHTISKINVYRIYLTLFTLILGPFVFFNVQKTKYLQYFTTVMRWFAFCTMIIAALVAIANGKGEGHPSKFSSITNVANLFGVSIYSFMCHHSLPSLVSPIRNKTKLTKLFAFDYILILSFYVFLCMTAIFCFATIEDLYTLNFSDNTVMPIKFFQYFLGLFPVFTLSASFPIIAITLRNNLQTLFSRTGQPRPWMINRIGFPLLTIIPPIIVAFVTMNVEFLVSFTGSYAGATIQYVFPSLLVYYCRKKTNRYLGEQNYHKHTSPFKSTLWIVFVNIWTVICIVLVTYYHISRKQ
ncbi:transmembrane protein 104-like [Anneissia japonica]|uniref:transmembrane protein 104-like n=1 Tax=Anneissia japonica TaxID=1529436 RepID=UPI0014258495|nr:transmembrane protein 104-like [Anneissia japonica]